MRSIINTYFLFILPVVTISLFSCGGDKKTSETAKPVTKEVVATTNSTADTNSEDSKLVSSNRKGKLVYKQYCTLCHGATGNANINGATDLTTSKVSMEERIDQITNGKGKMTPYKDILSEEQIKAVAEYLEELKK